MVYTENPDHGDYWSVHFDPRDDILSQVLLETVADIDGRPIEDINPLTDAVNPDALDALFDTKLDGTSRSEGTITFTYEGYSITIYSGGAMTLRERDAAR